MCVPLIATFLGQYAWLSMRTDSPVQTPEKLYRERTLLVSGLLVVISFITLMSVDLPFLYELFNVLGPDIDQLWNLGS